MLDGDKIYITNAPEAGVFTVFATLDPALGSRGIAAFLVDDLIEVTHAAAPAFPPTPAACVWR